jgi:hypothetical protein
MSALVVDGYNDRFTTKQVHLKLRKLQSESQGPNLKQRPAPTERSQCYAGNL